MLIIFIGDPKQLPPSVKSSNHFELTNPFLRAIKTIVFDCLQRRGFDVCVLTENFRAVEGLAQVYNKIFYDGILTDAECTKLNYHPDAKRAMDWTKEYYGVYNGIPHAFLNVHGGICLRSSETSSRFNLQNIVVVLHLIKQLLTNGIWTESQISVITPYREQAKRLRQAFKDAGFVNIKVVGLDDIE